MYLHKHIDKDKGLYLSYEIVDQDGNDEFELYPLGTWDKENSY